MGYHERSISVTVQKEARTTTWAIKLSLEMLATLPKVLSNTCTWSVYLKKLASPLISTIFKGHKRYKLGYHERSFSFTVRKKTRTTTTTIKLPLAMSTTPPKVLTMCAWTRECSRQRPCMSPPPPPSPPSPAAPCHSCCSVEWPSLHSPLPPLSPAAAAATTTNTNTTFSATKPSRYCTLGDPGPTPPRPLTFPFFPSTQDALTSLRFGTIP